MLFGDARAAGDETQQGSRAGAGEEGGDVLGLGFKKNPLV